MKTALGTLFLLLSHLAFAQKVANFSYGKPGTNEYEQLSFWVEGNKPTEIIYTYGKDRKESKVQYVGKGTLNGARGFRIGFPNGLILYVIPQTINLFVSDLSGKYSKRYAWQYEGPVNGIGTFCQPCARDEKEGIQLVKQAYLRE